MIEENKQGMFPAVPPEQEARLEPVTEADVRLSPEELAAQTEEERMQAETMRWKQVPPEPPKPPKPPRKPPQNRKKRRRKPPELRTLLLALIILVVSAMVCGAILLGHYNGDGATKRQKDSGFSDRSDASGGDDAWNYDSKDKEKTESLPAYNGDRTGVTLTLNNAIGKKALSYQELYQQCLPSTVSIAVENRDGAGSGSGVVLTENGYIITCAHVIDDQASAEVTINDGKSYTAQLVGSDPQTDLALLKIDATGLTPAQFGQDEELQVGDEALAIGDPLGVTFHGTLTNGIISGINRDVTLNGYSMTLIQTTAALNSGNSGGPLMNIYGQVIGINNMKMVSASTTVEGLGFAVPSGTVKEIIEKLATDGGISRPVLGVSCYGLDEKAAKKTGLKAGLVVAKVNAKSDCAAQGIQVDDVITAIDGKHFETVQAFKEYIADFPIGKTLTLTVSRPKTPIKDQKDTGDTSASAGDSSAQGEKEVTQVEYKEIGEVTVKLVDQRSLS